jgi:hypothetical protein
VEAQVPKNTKQKTKTDIDMFKRWMKSALPGDQRQIGLGNALFYGACINGGTFNVNINLQSN